jgi:hypothetical protein
LSIVDNIKMPALRASIRDLLIIAGESMGGRSQVLHPDEIGAGRRFGSLLLDEPRRKVGLGAVHIRGMGVLRQVEPSLPTTPFPGLRRKGALYFRPLLSFYE